MVRVYPPTWERKESSAALTLGRALASVIEQRVPANCVDPYGELLIGILVVVRGRGVRKPGTDSYQDDFLSDHHVPRCS